jgi:hypothetical protein
MASNHPLLVVLPRLEEGEFLVSTILHGDEVEVSSPTSRSKSDPQ